MRLVLDTNVLVSALLLPQSRPAQLIHLWIEGRLTLLTAETQIDEVGRVTRYPKIRERLKPALAGRLVNQLRNQAVMITTLPTVDASPDPADNFLLSIAAGGKADGLVTGDKRDLLSLKKFGGTRIVTASECLSWFGQDER